MWDKSLCSYRHREARDMCHSNSDCRSRLHWHKSGRVMGRQSRKHNTCHRHGICSYHWSTSVGMRSDRNYYLADTRNRSCFGTPSSWLGCQHILYSSRRRKYTSLGRSDKPMSDRLGHKYYCWAGICLRLDWRRSCNCCCLSRSSWYNMNDKRWWQRQLRDTSKDNSRCLHKLKILMW